PTATAIPPPTPTPAPLLVSEVCYDGTTSGTEGDEFVELYNPLSCTVDLAGYKIGDEETQDDSEGMYHLPITASIGPGEVTLVAKNAAQFQARFGLWPDFEMKASGSGYPDTPAVLDLERYREWGSGSWALSNSGDEVLLLGPGDALVDAAVYKSGDGEAVGVTGTLSAPEPRSLQRVLGPDSDDMPADFAIAEPNPGQLTQIPVPLDSPPPSANLGDGMRAYWGCLHSHSTYSDGSGPPRYAYAVGRANGLHFLALTDHSHMYDAHQWADLEAQAAAANEDGAFVALRGFEWTSRQEGHVNVFHTVTSVSRDDPPYDGLAGFYPWLAGQEEAIAQFNHPFAGDFADFAYDQAADERIRLLEVGNGNRAQYRRFEEAYLQALGAGWRVGPANNGDTETPDWGADTPHRTGIAAPALTRDDLLDALRARRTFAAGDSNLALALRADETWMGETLPTSGELELTVVYRDGDGEDAEVALYDRTLPLGTTALSSNSDWITTVSSLPGHFYWARVEQADGDLAYTSPLWVAGQAPPEEVFLNEFCPVPLHEDWDGSGEATTDDEWIELYNGEEHAVGLGGWRLDDEADSGSAPWTFTLTQTIPSYGYLVLFKDETGVALNDSGDTVRLLRPDGSVADEMSYARSPGYDRTWSRTEDGGGEWTADYKPTMGETNEYEREEPSPKKEPAAPVPQAVSLAQAKALSLGTLVVVQGQVTAPPGALKGTIYIQNAGTGMKVYLSEGNYPLLTEGDWIQVEGKLSDYHGEREITVASAEKVQWLRVGTQVGPLSIATGELGEAHEGLLVEMVGRVTGWGWDAIYLDDGSGEAKVYFGRSERVEKPWVEEGELYLVVGLVSQYDGGCRLLPRYEEDVISAPLELPITGGDLPSHER
ncbi:MAG: lamin tail domain-containing protein, partial [Chloroflexota bacterium]|nr:lamin tail domain-containing protein [Chloroflexota bacterium]